MIRKFIKASTWVLASNLGAKVLNFTLLNILARCLNPTGFGVYNAIIASATSINQVCDMGSTMVLQRSSARLEELKADKAGSRFLIIFLLQLGCNLIFTLCIFVFPGFFDQLLFHNSIADKPIQLIGLVAIMQIIFQVPLAFVLGLGEFRKYAFRMILSNAITLACTGFVFWVFEISIQYALWGLIAALLINALLSWFVLRKIIDRHQIPLRVKQPKKELAEVIHEGIIYYSGNVLAGAIFNFLIIGLFSKHIGIEEYGYVRIGSALVSIMSIVPSAIQSVNLTFLARNESSAPLLKSMQLRFIAASSFLLSIFLICYINVLVRLFFGTDYLAGKPIFIFIILINIIMVITSVITNFLVSKGHGNYVGMISSIGVLLNIIFSFILIPKIGIYGFFIGQTIGYGFGFIFVLIKEFKTYGYPDVIRIRNLAFVILFGLIGVIPLYYFTAGIWLEMYKILYLLILVATILPLAINSIERARFIELLKMKFMIFNTPR